MNCAISAPMTKNKRWTKKIYFSPHTSITQHVMAAVFSLAKNVGTQAMEYIRFKAHDMYWYTYRQMAVYVQQPQVGDKWTAHLLNQLHCYIVPFRANRGQKANTNNSCKCLTTFKEVPEAAYGLLASQKGGKHQQHLLTHQSVPPLTKHPEHHHQCKDTDTRNTCSLLCVLCHLMVTFTGTCHVFSNVYAPLPTVPYFSQKTKKFPWLMGWPMYSDST